MCSTFPVVLLFFFVWCGRHNFASGPFLLPDY